MVLLNELYTIKDCSVDEGKAVFNIKLNPDHFIYKAHFPNEPITPGVCIIQIAVELMGMYFERSLQLSRVKNVKFLTVMSPKDVADVTYTISSVCVSDDGEAVKSHVLVTSKNNQYAKLSLVCK